MLTVEDYVKNRTVKRDGMSLFVEPIIIPIIQSKKLYMPFLNKKIKIFFRFLIHRSKVRIQSSLFITHSKIKVFWLHYYL